MSTETIDVLIVGAGPTGTALAIDLVRRGVTVRIIDRAAAGFDGSRAKGVQPRTLEVLEDLGALADVLAGGATYPRLGIHAGPLTIPWAMNPQRRATADVPYPNTWLIPQHRTDSALRAQLRELGAEVEFDCALTGFEQRTEVVAATVSTPDGDRRITCRYLVGADGGASTVRKTAGIGFEGRTDESDRMIIVDAEVEGLPPGHWHVWPRLGGRFIGACPLPHSDQFQWMIRLDADEEPSLELDDLNARIRAHIGDKGVRLRKIYWKSVFRPNIRLADRYRAGRVFLAGDAAHVHTPAGAQGLNTGIQDAYNLGWKLAQVLHGAPDALLDTYEAERRPIAARVLGLSTKKYEGLARLDPSSIKRGDDERQLGLHYRGGPLADNAAERTRTLRVGDRVPDAILTDAGGQSRRLFTLMAGPQFTAIAYGPEAASELAGLSWPTAGAPLSRLCVDPGTAREHGIALSDTGGRFAKSFGLTAATLLLIRPDGYLAAIATENRVEATESLAAGMVPAHDRATSV
ncbi:FAD-dependent oxidoreductase [Nocardia otitidiscaviarum]|uniref:FAD-dependent oxidoreductase n=1 Tax=Nocardia otitidiscaviarum TaxID=1823 RepID=UPI0018931CE0|nr:FAD-dependent oxidoreductase [Nocardia otitidiscaviarum]MBF6180043.1 FAD-dependent oxidoreductase [Nocardia otitidiscaviarum]